MSVKPPRVAPPQPSEGDFWKTKSLEELAAEQGVRPIERLEEILGQGEALWADDAELDAFLQALRESRRVMLPSRNPDNVRIPSVANKTSGTKGGLLR